MTTNWIAQEGSEVAVAALSLAQCLERFAGLEHDQVCAGPLGNADVVAQRLAEKADVWRDVLRMTAA